MRPIFKCPERGTSVWVDCQQREPRPSDTGRSVGGVGGRPVASPAAGEPAGPIGLATASLAQRRKLVVLYGVFGDALGQPRQVEEALMCR